MRRVGSVVPPSDVASKNDRAVEFKFEAAVQLGLKNEPVAEIELDDALPLGGERARRNERCRSLAKRNVEHEMRAHRRVLLGSVLRLESDRQPVEQHRLGLGGGYTGAWPTVASAKKSWASRKLIIEPGASS